MTWLTGLTGVYTGKKIAKIRTNLGVFVAFCKEGVSFSKSVK
jgi:hypothetical protein